VINPDTVTAVLEAAYTRRIEANLDGPPTAHELAQIGTDTLRRLIPAIAVDAAHAPPLALHYPIREVSGT
jgi:hypothetical protein